MCTKVSQQSDVESSLNGLNELLHPEPTAQRKQQGREPGRGTPSPQATPSPSKRSVGSPGTAELMGQEASREWEGGARLLTEKVRKGRNIPFCFNFPPSLKSTPS